METSTRYPVASATAVQFTWMESQVTVTQTLTHVGAPSAVEKLLVTHPPCPQELVARIRKLYEVSGVSPPRPAMLPAVELVAPLHDVPVPNWYWYPAAPAALVQVAVALVELTPEKVGEVVPIVHTKFAIRLVKKLILLNFIEV